MSSILFKDVLASCIRSCRLVHGRSTEMLSFKRAQIALAVETLSVPVLLICHHLKLLLTLFLWRFNLNWNYFHHIIIVGSCFLWDAWVSLQFQGSGNLVIARVYVEIYKMSGCDIGRRARTSLLRQAVHLILPPLRLALLLARVDNFLIWLCEFLFRLLVLRWFKLWRLRCYWFYPSTAFLPSLPSCICGWKSVISQVDLRAIGCACCWGHCSSGSFHQQRRILLVSQLRITNAVMTAWAHLFRCLQLLHHS